MWCGGCYTSDPTLPFHVDSLGKNAESGEEDPGERERMVMTWRAKLRDPTDFHVGRRGDHLITPFECYLCVFRKLRREDPNPGTPTDDLLLGLIRQMNLDAFWSQESGTVLGNANQVAASIERSKLVGLEGAYEDTGTYDLTNHCGYEIASNILLHSRRPGKHSNVYTQFGAIRKLRSAYGNQVRASASANAAPYVMVDEKGIYKRLVVDKCGSLWFSCFMVGLQKRMGQIWKPNKALSVKQLIGLLEKAND